MDYISQIYMKVLWSAFILDEADVQRCLLTKCSHVGNAWQFDGESNPQKTCATDYRFLTLYDHSSRMGR